MARDFDAEIRTLNAELDATREEMARMRETVLETAATMLAAWTREYAVTLVKKEPEVTKALPREQLADLKASISAYADRAPALVDQAIGAERYWYHLTLADPPRNDDGPPPYHRVGRDLADPFRKPLRYAMGGIATLLTRAGYMQGPFGAALWKSDPNVPFSSGGGRYFFPGPLPDAPALHATIALYEASYNQAKGAVAQRAAVQYAKAEAEADALWDSA